MNIKEQLSKFKVTLCDFGIKIRDNSIDILIKAKEWIEENPEIAATVFVPIAVAGLHSGQSLIVSHRQNTQQRRANMQWYDRSSGLKWDLKRPMTNSDRKAIMELRNQGVDTIDILINRNLI